MWDFGADVNEEKPNEVFRHESPNDGLGRCSWNWDSTMLASPIKTSKSIVFTNVVRQNMAVVSRKADIPALKNPNPSIELHASIHEAIGHRFGKQGGDV